MEWFLTTTGKRVGGSLRGGGRFFNPCVCPHILLCNTYKIFWIYMSVCCVCLSERVCVRIFYYVIHTKNMNLYVGVYVCVSIRMCLCVRIFKLMHFFKVN